MTRRTFGVLAGLATTGRGADSAKQSQFGIAKDSYRFRPVMDSIEFLERAHGLGAAGIQTPITSFEPEYLDRLKRRAAELNMYLEVSAALPKADMQVFVRTMDAAKAVGAAAVRTACLSGRRYENFSSLADWQRFVAEAKAGIARAVPIADRVKIPLGIENHKDWTVDEMVPLLRSYSSEYLGACVDTGNNISLLDDPIETVQKLAPFAVTTHIKDMAVAEYPEGFLLSEVPMGTGCLDMRRIIDLIRGMKPRIKLNIEMITRNPLPVPCLTDRYWATFPDRNGSFLARTMRLVRTNLPAGPLPVTDGLDPAAQARLEDENLKRCLAFV